MRNVQRGDPLQNSQNGRFFWLKALKKQEILVRFWPKMDADSNDTKSAKKK